MSDMQKIKKRPLGGGNNGKGDNSTFSDRTSEKPSIDDVLEKAEQYEKAVATRKERSYGSCGCGG
jgi:hypothetical protein